MALIALVLSAAAALSGGQPPLDLGHGRNLDRIEVEAQRHLIQGTPGYDLEQRRVWVTYAATTLGARPRAVASRRLEERTAFWPTAVATIDDEHLAVGGRFSERGKTLTVIEVWRLRAPGIELDARGEATLTGIGLVERSRIYESDQPGRDMVRTLVRLRGRSRTLLAQFHDSGDVVELEYGPVREAGPWKADPARLVLASEPRAGALYVPALANRALVEVSVQESAANGIVYTFRPSPSLRMARSGSEPDQRPLLLIDNDRDGAIDAWRTPEPRPAKTPLAQRAPR
jgi:hypothetical protein